MIDHWEALFDSNYLRWFHLEGKEHTVTVAKVEQRELTLRGGIKKKAPVVTFERRGKPLVLNKTNARAMAEIFGTVKTKEWVGCEITLYESATQMFNQETKKIETVPCIRLKKATS